jgi:hypothetical protein
MPATQKYTGPFIIVVYLPYLWSLVRQPLYEVSWQHDVWTGWGRWVKIHALADLSWEETAQHTMQILEGNKLTAHFHRQRILHSGAKIWLLSSSLLYSPKQKIVQILKVTWSMENISLCIFQYLTLYYIINYNINLVFIYFNKVSFLRKFKPQYY